VNFDHILEERTFKRRAQKIVLAQQLGFGMISPSLTFVWPFHRAGPVTWTSAAWLLKVSSCRLLPCIFLPPSIPHADPAHHTDHGRDRQLARQSVSGTPTRVFVLYLTGEGCSIIRCFQTSRSFRVGAMSARSTTPTKASSLSDRSGSSKRLRGCSRY
jgi:hypothetical protein